MAGEIPADLKSFWPPLKHTCARESREGGFIDLDTNSRDTLKGKKLSRTGGKSNSDRKALGCFGPPGIPTGQKRGRISNYKHVNHSVDELKHSDRFQ